MAEGILKSFDNSLEIFSAGTHPANEVNPYAVFVMKEIGIDISSNKPKHVDQFLSQEFDYVITVCDHAKETCPVFIGNVKHQIHIGFEDPSEASGTHEEILSIFRQVRDAIRNGFQNFYTDNLK